MGGSGARKETFERIIFFVFLSMIFLLALTKIQDVDAWLHLSSGRAIWENGGFPPAEPYVYTMEGKPFSHGAWLFAVVYYLAYHVFSVYGVTLLKAATITAAFFILLKDALRPYRNLAVAIAVLGVVALFSRHRFVERPDTLLMVYLPFTIFALNAFVYDRKNYLYLLPLVHLLWANSHTSIVLMTVPFAAFIGGGIIQYYAGKKGLRFEATPDLNQLKKMAAIFVLSFAASLINPFFIRQYFLGAQFMGVEFFKQEITELLPPTWDSDPRIFLLAGVVIASFVTGWGLRFRAQARAGRGGSALPYASLIHFLLVLPFLYLQFSAVRFFFLFAVVSGPVIARNISHSIALWREGGLKRSTGGAGPVVPAVVLGLFVLFGGLTLFGVRTFMAPDEYQKFGFGFDPVRMPEGALRYMDEKDIQGRVFNIYHWGQYIIWKGYPKRTVFVDGRGYLPVDLLEKTHLARRRKDVLDELYQAYHFESVLVDYPIDKGGISGLNYDQDRALSHPGWALVYWDDTSLLYLRRNGPYQAIIDRDEYRFVRPANLVTGAAVRLRNETYRVNFVREVLRNVEATGSSSAYAFLGYVYSESGLYRQAIEAYVHVRPYPGRDFLQAALAGIAQAYGKLDDVDSAISYYERALALEPDATLYYKLGLAHLSKGEKRRAVRYFERALALSRDLLSVYPLLISAYRDLGMEGKAADAAARYKRSQVVGKGEEHFKAGLAAYLAHNYEQAADEFARSIEVNPGNPVAYSNLGYIYYDMGLIDRAYPYQRKAVEIDPNYANAHYGLALIYKQQGDRAMARHHWEEYLRIEPAGYYSRKAKEELRSLK